MNKRLLAMASILLLGVLFSGCIFSIDGGEGKSPSVKQSTTAGQELIDLKKAFDQGAITEEEYHQKKQQILSSD